MDNITDLITTGNGYVDAGVAAGTVALTWLTARFAWWKAQSKGVKVLTAVGLFLAVAITLSLITAPFT